MSKTIIQKFGERIRLLREATGLSQEKFALLIEMDRSYYASVERGERNIALENVGKIAKGLDVSISELFEGVE